MVIILDFVAVANDLIFTVDQITWTIGFNNLATTIMEEAIRSTSITSSSASATTPTMLAMASTTPAMSPTTPITCCPLLSYKGRQIDDTDLLGLSTKLFGLIALTTCPVAIIIAMKNNAMTTATTVMITCQKVEG